MQDELQNNSIIARKDEIRKEIIGRLRGQDPAQREERSEIAQEKLLSSGEFKGAKTVLTYVSLPQEVSTEKIITEAMKQGKRVAVPYVEPDDLKIVAAEITTIDNLKKGPFGIRQPEKSSIRPIPLKEIDLVIVPGIAYDYENMRLGRGKGYYDSFLSQEGLSPSKKIGLAFKFQIVKALPKNSHDIPVDRVITD